MFNVITIFLVEDCRLKKNKWQTLMVKFAYTRNGVRTCKMVHFQFIT